MKFTHKLLDLDVEFEAGHRAWNAYEVHTGRSVLVDTRLRHLLAPGMQVCYDFGWALSAKWRAIHAPNWTFATFLDALPPMGTESWNELRASLSDVVSQAFHGVSWADLLAFCNSKWDEVEANADAVTSG